MLPEFKKSIKVQLEQHQIDALACLAYNIGNGGFKTSSVLKNINENIKSGEVIEKNWKAWNKGGGKVLQGLVNRREGEYKYFTKGIL